MPTQRCQQDEKSPEARLEAERGRVQAEVLMEQKTHTHVVHTACIPGRLCGERSPSSLLLPLSAVGGGRPRANAGAQAASPTGPARGWGAGTLCFHPADPGRHWLALILRPTPRGS